MAILLARGNPVHYTPVPDDELQALISRLNAKMRLALTYAAAGLETHEFCKRLDISVKTYYRWCQTYKRFRDAIQTVRAQSMELRPETLREMARRDALRFYHVLYEAADSDTAHIRDRLAAAKEGLTLGGFYSQELAPGISIQQLLVQITQNPRIPSSGGLPLVTEAETLRLAAPVPEPPRSDDSPTSPPGPDDGKPLEDSMESSPQLTIEEKAQGRRSAMVSRIDSWQAEKGLHK